MAGGILYFLHRHFRVAGPAGVVAAAAAIALLALRLRHP